MRVIEQKDYLYKTKPYEHQAKAFMLSRDEPEYGYLMEMGTGKTKTTIDVASWLWSQGKINFFLISAPNDVHRNWITREIPPHMPDWVPRRTCIWSANMKAADWEDFWSLFDPEFTGLRVLAVNHDAFSAGERFWKTPSTDKTKPRFGTAITMIMNSFKVLFAVDESSKIKTPGARRSQRHCVIGKKALYRRILTGTLGGPLEAYMQFNFLNPEILGGHPAMNYFSYKHRYANWQTERNHKTGKNYEVCTGYKRIDELQAKIASKSFRVLKKDCLDLPDKVYKRRPCQMEKEQKRLYDRAKNQSILELNQEDRTIANVLVKYLRLQQIMGGWLPSTEPDMPAQPIFDNLELNPRISSLMEVIEENPDQQVIIWARFRAEIEAITVILNSVYGDGAAVSFYGGTSKEDRADAIDGFQSGKHRFFVANAHSGGYGLTLTAATCVIYYSNDFSLEARLQSEDRCHRIGQTSKVLYVDIEMPGTLDGRILGALRGKKNLADTVVGDDPSEWF